MDRNSETVLREAVQFFRVLRSLAQERKCLALFVAAYRPDLNRQNQLSPEVGENPLFMSIQEHFLGFLTAEESTKMLREIGLWKDIRWTDDALARTFEFCGGHPLLTRQFASDASEQGRRKEIDLDCVERTAAEVISSFVKHRIGRYYRESIWNLLRQEERPALVYSIDPQSATRPKLNQDAVTSLEHFGLIEKNGEEIRARSILLREWLRRHAQ
jgi:hypothetical protein